MSRSRLALTLAAVLVVLLSNGCSHQIDLKPPRPGTDSSDSRAAAAQRTLDGFAAAINGHKLDSLRDVGTTASLSLLRKVANNAAAIGLGDLSLRFVDQSTSGPTQSGEAIAEPGAWTGSVQFSYRLTPWDQNPTLMEVGVGFAEQSGTVRIIGFGGAGDRTPLWLSGPLVVTAGGRTLVLAKNAEDSRQLSRMAIRAVSDVKMVLPRWRGKLVIEAAGSEDELNATLGAEPTQYSNIAGVTTTVDGSLVPGAPVHVFINPAVFDKLGPKGAQVVLSHEATHVATGATFADMPTWLLEGFADYVALDHAGVPVGTAAAQILAKVRKHGPPTRLPTSADLDPTANGLGATYEEAWLACRFIGQEYGEASLVRFYQAASAGQPIQRLFRQILGTAEGAFVTRWAADVAGLARSTRARVAS